MMLDSRTTSKHGTITAVEAALELGANANGHRDQPCAPIVVAFIDNHVGIANILVEQEADPYKPVTVESPPPIGAKGKRSLGTRALHIETSIGNVEVIRLPLKPSCADPKATNNKRRTPLVLMCSFECVNVQVVSLLLEAGADQALADDEGYINWHMVAVYGNTHLVDILHLKAPTSINPCVSPLALHRSFWHAAEITRA